MNTILNSPCLIYWTYMTAWLDRMDLHVFALAFESCVFPVALIFILTIVFDWQSSDISTKILSPDPPNCCILFKLQFRIRNSSLSSVFLAEFRHVNYGRIKIVTTGSGRDDQANDMTAETCEKIQINGIRDWENLSIAIMRNYCSLVFSSKRSKD